MNDDKKDKPSNKKKKEPSSSSPTPAVDPLIEKVIKEAILAHIAGGTRQRKNVDEFDAMTATCQEFMKSFIILGYDFSGNAVQPIVFAHNQQEADALGAYLGKFVQASIREIGPDQE